MDQRTAARILDLADERARSRGSRSRAFAGFALILALAAHGGASSGSPRSAQAAAMSPAGARQAFAAQAGESPEMKQLMAIGVAAAVSAGASAQDAVQWRVEDGGNGHCYAVNESYLFWHEARAAALLQGGDLTSLETNEEWTWMRSWLPPILHGYLLGGYQLPRSPSPSDGWKWLTGGDVQRNWMVMDDNPCGASPAGIEDDQQDYLHTCCQETGWGGCVWESI